MMNRFNEDGFVIIRKAIHVDGLQAALRGLFAIYGNGSGLFDTVERLDRENKPLLYKLFQITRRLPALQAIQTELLPLVQQLLNQKGYLMNVGGGVLFGLPSDKRLVYDWHQETSYIKETSNFVNVWFPVIEAGSKENGAMSVLKGTHKLGPLDFKEQKAAGSSSYTDHIPQDIKRIVAEHEEVHCLTEPGDCVLFHAALIHRSNANVSPRTRFSGVIRVADITFDIETLDYSL